MLFTDYLWDFDGTLFDTYPRMARAFREMIRSKGLEVPHAEVLALLKRSAGQAAEVYARRLGIQPQTLLGEYHCRERALPEPYLPYPDAAAVCARICERGGRNFLYTHRDSGALAALSQCGMDGCFADFVTADDTFPAKPAPDAILHLMRKNGIDPACAVMVGDRDIDIEAGRNAGISGCLFDPDGFYADYSVGFRVSALSDMMELMGID